MIVRPIIPALRMIRHENFEFKASLSNVVRPCFKHQGQGMDAAQLYRAGLDISPWVSSLAPQNKEKKKPQNIANYFGFCLFALLVVMGTKVRLWAYQATELKRSNDPSFTSPDPRMFFFLSF